MILGDFNSTGHNLKYFRRFSRRHDFENWSKEIKYTYSQATRKKSIGGTSGGLCNTKPDQVFTLNFPENSLRFCKTDLSIVTKGGHLPIKTQAALPHIDLVDVDDEDDDGDDFDAPRVDWKKVTDVQEEEFRYYSAELLNDFKQTEILTNDPIYGITKLYNKI